MAKRIKGELEVRIDQMLDAYKTGRIKLDAAAETIMALLAVQDTQTVPMGVSPWRDQGRDYGYVDYFLDSLYDPYEDDEDQDEEKEEKAFMFYETMGKAYSTGYNKALSDIREKLT
jgi:hypothetical protein